MAAPKRSKAQREADLADMARLMTEGATERDLADRFGLSTGTISRDMKTVTQRWKDAAALSIDEWKAKLLAGRCRIRGIKHAHKPLRAGFAGHGAQVIAGIEGV